MKIKQLKDGITRIEIPNWLANLIKFAVISSLTCFCGWVKIELNRSEKIEHRLDNLLAIVVNEETKLTLGQRLDEISKISNEQNNQLKNQVEKQIIDFEKRISDLEKWQIRIEDRNTPKQLTEIRTELNLVENNLITIKETSTHLFEKMNRVKDRLDTTQNEVQKIAKETAFLKHVEFKGKLSLR